MKNLFKKINVNALLLAANALAISALLLFVLSTEKEAGLVVWAIMSLMMIAIITVQISEKLGQLATFITSFTCLAPILFYTARLTSLVDTVVITEAIKVGLFLLLSLESVGEKNSNRPSQIFWRLIISTAIFDTAMLAIYYGENAMLAISASALIILKTWAFLPKIQEESEKTELEKINYHCLVIIGQKNSLPMIAIALLFCALSLQIRSIFLASNSPIEQQAQLVAGIIIMLMSVIMLLALSYIMNRLLNKKLDSLWSQKMLILT